jgi:hypothetical protein
MSPTTAYLVGSPIGLDVSTICNYKHPSGTVSVQVQWSMSGVIVATSAVILCYTKSQIFSA